MIICTQWAALGNEVIDWDESTFILIADRLAEGHLPYIDLYDNKPPLVFVLFAGVIAVFGESLIAIRVFGDLLLLANALLVFAIARRLTGGSPALGAGLLLIFIHAVREGQHSSTELPAMTMILGACWSLLVWRRHLWGVALAGLLISLATLTRSNLGLVAVVFGAYIALVGVPGPAGRRRLGPLAAYTLAGLAPPAAFAALYALQGGLDAFWLATVTVPLNYAGDQIGPLEALRQHAIIWHSKVSYNPLWIGGFSLLVMAGTLVLVLQMRRSTGRPERSIVVLMFGAVTLSVLQSGAAYTHYLLQVFPFAAIFAAFFLQSLHRWRIGPWVGLAAVAAVGVVPLHRMAPAALWTMSHPGTITTDHDIRTAADKIAAVLGPEDKVWALRQHLILWYLDRQPISRVGAHPDNIVRDAIIDPLVASGYAPKDVLSTIYDSRPAFVILDGTADVPAYLPDPDQFKAFLDGHYTQFYRNRDVTVFRRIASGAAD